MAVNMEAPQQLHTCSTCDGSGVQVYGCTVYEAGCHFSHESSDERECPDCKGSGFDEVIEVEPDSNDDYATAIWGEHSQFGVGA